MKARYFSKIEDLNWNSESLLGFERHSFANLIPSERHEESLSLYSFI